MEVWNGARERERGAQAEMLATLYNAHFETKGVPFEAGDFINPGSRKDRILQTKAERMKSRVSAFKAALPGADPGESVPQFFLDLHERRKAQNRVN